MGKDGEETAFFPIDPAPAGPYSQSSYLARLPIVTLQRQTAQQLRFPFPARPESVRMGKIAL